MTNRELAAYLLVAGIAFAFLIGWRIASVRRRRDRRSQHSRIDLIGRDISHGKAPESRPGRGQADVDPARPRTRSED
jgi:hypothetical protein